MFCLETGWKTTPSKDSHTWWSQNTPGWNPWWELFFFFWTNVSPSLPACFLLLSFLSMGCGIWGFYRSQKRALYPLELELHAIVRHPRWMLKFKLWSSTKAKSALKSWTIILSLRLILKLNKLKYHVLVFWYNIFGEPNTNVAENVI